MTNLLNSRKSFLLPFVLLLFIVVLLLISSLLILTPKIENDLAEKIQQELQKHSINADIGVSGRDIALTGKVKDLKIRNNAEMAISKVCGIRFLDNQLLVDRIDQEREEASKVVAKPEKQPKLDTVIEDTPNKLANIATNKAEPIKDSEPQKESTVSQTTTTAVATDETSTTTKLDENTLAAATSTPDSKPAEQQTAVQEKPAESLLATQAPAPKSKPEEQTVKEEKPEETLLAKANETKPEIIQEKATKPATSAAEKKTARKNLDYETMLAAMQEYNKNKQLQKKTSLNKTLSIYFSETASDIPDSAKEELDSFASTLKNQNDKKIELIVAAKDSALALLRGKAIKSYLVQQGIDQQQIVVTTKADSGDQVSFKELEN